jgi:hypothetical protein
MYDKILRKEIFCKNLILTKTSHLDIKLSKKITCYLLLLVIYLISQA